MANKNKKISRIVKVPDPNRPSEFAPIPTLTQPVRGPALAASTGEQTYDVDKARTTIADKSVADLHALLDERICEIEELEFRLEQSLGRQRCLEEELKVREEITGTINEDMRTAREQLLGAASELQKLNAEYTALRSAFIELNEHTQTMRIEADQSRNSAVLQLQRIVELEKELESSRAELSDLRAYVSGRKHDWEEHEQELTRLRGDLATTFGRTQQLSIQLQQEKSRNQEIERERDALKVELEQEVRRIQFELTTAEDTIADQETVNEQLASDLIDNLQFRQALETHVGEMERKNEKTIQNLKRQLHKARKEMHAYESKLQAKNAAITDLMHELASQGRDTECGDDGGNVLQSIGGFQPGTGQGKVHGDRDRVARLLIGNADGRTLRFPLFKDRLTIGRTSHNDIQLDLRYVSRRHAVIATDNNRTRIIDWGSRNGVFVNKKRITEKVLSHGDVITIGLADLRYEERAKR